MPKDSAPTFYGYRCYSHDGAALGWLYTCNSDRDLAHTQNLDWCLRWKTLRGAQKNFAHYQHRWHFSQGGYLQIELMPAAPSDPYEPQQKWQEAHPDPVKQSKSRYDAANPVWSVRLSADLRDWLELQRGVVKTRC